MARKKVNKTLVVFLIFAAAILVFLFALFQSPPVLKEFVANRTFATTDTLFFHYEITRYPALVQIISTNSNLSIGLATDPWRMNFGRIPVGGDSTRIVALGNSQQDFKIYFNVYGNISSLVGFSQNNFWLNAGQNVNITAIVLTSNSTVPGNYSGEIDIIAKTPNYPSLSFLT